MVDCVGNIETAARHACIITHSLMCLASSTHRDLTLVDLMFQLEKHYFSSIILNMNVTKN